MASVASFRSYPFRKLADYLHDAAPVLSPEVRRVGRKEHQVGVQVLPSHLIIVELRPKAGWWMMSYYLDPRTGIPLEDPASVMRGVNSEKSLAVEVDDIRRVALHVLLRARGVWGDALSDPASSAQDKAWATRGVAEMRAAAARGEG